MRMIVLLISRLVLDTYYIRNIFALETMQNSIFII